MRTERSHEQRAMSNEWLRFAALVVQNAGIREAKPSLLIAQHSLPVTLAHHCF
jgi:hypothetical protein